jgi:microcystin-dependent protein
VSRTTYATLFTAISTTYGVGDNSTTFNLPDLRGRVIAAVDNMGGTDAGRLDLANTLGTTAGTQTHTLTSAQIPAHSHPNTATVSITGGAHTHQMTSAASGAPASGGDVPLRASGGFDGGFRTQFESTGSAYGSGLATHTHSGTVTMTNANNTGGGSAHNNMQPTILMNYIIKT